jgi:HD domain
MAVPGRVEAASVLLELDPPDRFIRHSRAVAEVAAFLAARAASRGQALDRRLTEAAALLHDVDKRLPPGDPARRRPHGAGSADWLTRRGFPELAEAVSRHPVTRLLSEDPAGDPRASLEALIVAYADKRVRQRLIPMPERFAIWRGRHPGTWSAEEWRRIEARAARLEARVCAAAGVEPDTVSRLRWVDRALALARRHGPAGREPAARHEPALGHGPS